jgi:hypothetical protein
VTEVANEVIEQRDEAVKTFEPWVGFDNFGDSNITFWVLGASQRQIYRLLILKAN